MSEVRLTDDEWNKMRDVLRADPQAYVGRDEQGCGRFVDAIKGMSRSGAQGRLLPAE